MTEIYAWTWDLLLPPNSKVMLLCGANPERMRSIIEDQFDCTYIHPIKRNCGFVEAFERKGEDLYLVCLCLDWVNGDTQVPTLVHEVAHLVFTMFKENKWPLPVYTCKDNDEELFNDYLQHWTQNCLVALNATDKHKQIFLFDDEKKYPAKKLNDRHEGISSNPVQDSGNSQCDPRPFADKKPEIRELGPQASESFFESVGGGTDSCQAR